MSKSTFRAPTVTYTEAAPVTESLQVAGILLASVGSWCDKAGVHPVSEAGIPDLSKDMTVHYSEIEFIEFTEMMSVKDATLYRTAMSEYWANGNPFRDSNLRGI
jgi:hypothetical protein